MATVRSRRTNDAEPASVNGSRNARNSVSPERILVFLTDPWLTDAESIIVRAESTV